MPKESLKGKTDRAAKIVRLLKRQYPDVRCTLDYDSVHQLLVATILSAQCTDERVNKVTPGLFRKYRSIKSFAETDLTQLGRDIYSTGFYNAKAKSIKNSAMQIIERHGGKVPATLDELVKLAGVGRKTASVILGAGYSLAEGIVVDTHVGRISRLLKLSGEKNPIKVERQLMKLIPHEGWIILSHLLIRHGRETCIARRPDCKGCILNVLCPSAAL